MKTWKTRIMSAMLALLTLLTLLPTSALAASGSGTGIKATTDPNLWSTRLTSTGQQYSYRPPMAAGKQLYCMDLGYSYRYGTASFLNSYTYQSATGADADALWEKAVAKTGLGEMDAAVKENVKWMMSYIADYTGDIPGSLFMALQTYIWDHQSDKSAGGDTSGDIDAGGFANADTYETYVGYYNWMLAQKAKEDAELQKQIEEYTAQGKQASIVEDMSGKWAVLATSGTAGRQSFFAYHAARKVVTDDKPEGGDNPPPPVAGDGDITFKKVIAGTTHGLDGAVFNIYRDGQIVGSDVTRNGGIIEVKDVTKGLWTFVEVEALEGYALDPTPHSVYVDTTDGDKQYTVSASNSPLPSLKITKADAQTFAKVKATFLVESLTGSYSTTVTVDGEKTLPDLQPGVYRVTEQSVEEPYIKTGTHQDIALLAGAGTVEAAFTNYVKPGLEILKKNIATGEPIAHVTYKIEQIDGSYSTTATTDGAGRIFLANIPVGSYKVTEVNVPSDVILCDIPQTIALGPGETRTVTFFNAMKPSLKIIKRCEVSLTFDNEPSTTLVIHKYIEGTENEPLSGVAFKVVDGSGAAVGPDDGVYYTDKAGEIVLNGLEPGTTVVAREIKSVDGFVLDGTPQDILIKAGTVQNLTFWNKRQGALIINKLDAVTKKPLAGVTFKITTATGEFVPDENGKISSNGLYYTDENGQIILKGVTGTLVVTEEKSIPGYTIDENTRTQTVVVNPDDTQSLCFYNAPIGGVELIKVNAADKTQRIPNTTFEIRRVSDGGLVDTVTTGPDGRVYVPLASDSYYAVETEAGKGYQLDSTPIYFTVEEGKMTTKTVTNKAISGILIHKVNAITGEGIPGVTFLLYDGNHRPIGEYTSDQRGYVYIDDLTESGRFYLRELENEGYVSDTELKTVYVRSGEVTELTWENTPICGQIQVIKKSANDNPINGLPAGTLLEGAVFEITDKAGNVVDTIRTNNRGLAVSKRLPLSRYFVREVKAPEHYGISEKELTVYLEHEGQIVRIETENKSLATGISITKTGPKEIMANQPVRYAFSNIANTSNVSLSNFYWRDTIPAQVRLEKVVTGTYNFPGTYKIVYRVNGGDYRTLADNLSTSKNYTLAASSVALGLASNERVTEIMFVFGQAPAGFSQVEAPYLHCKAVAGLPAGSFVNVADAGGTYNGTWVQAVSRWVTSVYGKPTVPKLPRTGY